MFLSVFLPIGTSSRSGSRRGKWESACGGSWQPAVTGPPTVTVRTADDPKAPKVDSKELQNGKLQLNSLLFGLSAELEPRPKGNSTDIQYAEAEKNRVKSVYDDFYRRYAGRRALSVFIVDNVSEDGQSNFRLVVRPKTERIGKTGPRYWAYVGPFSELLLSRADALNVNKGDEVHCWAIIDPSGTECVDYASDNRPSYYMEKVGGRDKDTSTH